MKVEDNARLWIGTKFQHQGRKRGIGCDCVGLILGIASELNIRAKSGSLLAEYDYQYYKNLYIEFDLFKALRQHMVAIATQKIGCVVAVKAKFSYHLGIICSYRIFQYSDVTYEDHFSIIHACMKAGCVVEHRFIEDMFSNCEIKYFSFFDI
ncbi:MAG: hypothetical protein ACRY3E_05325 [Candidatus Lariskella arthropodorum]